MSLLAAYVVCLTKLQVATRTLDGVRIEVPYKPALLLAVLEGVEEGVFAITASLSRPSSLRLLRPTVSC
jgi:hypothetical protein